MEPLEITLTSGLRGRAEAWQITVYGFPLTDIGQQPREWLMLGGQFLRPPPQNPRIAPE
jgi:hypothetical protein